MPTFLARFRRALPSDFVEWVLSIGVLALGILWLVFPASFYRPDMVDFLDIMSPRLWTTSAIMIGLISCVAIAATTETPRIAGLLRIVANFCRLALFGAFLGRSITASSFDMFSASIGIIWYSIFFILDGRNLMRTTSETFNVFRKVYRVRPVSLVR